VDSDEEKNFTFSYDARADSPSIFDKGISLKDFTIGNIVSIDSVKFKVVEYENEHTRKTFHPSPEIKTFAMIKPDAILHMGEILFQIYNSGFKINRMKMSRFTPESAEIFYEEHVNKTFFPSLSEFMSSGVCLGMELIKDNAVKDWRLMIGPTNSLKARTESPHSIRAQFGSDGSKNAAHGSDSSNSVLRELDLFFGDTNIMPTELKNNGNAYVLKTELRDKNVTGSFIQFLIDSNFTITAIEKFQRNSSQQRKMIENSDNSAHLKSFKISEPILSDVDSSMQSTDYYLLSVQSESTKVANHLLQL
jgi:nucleoside-diphosphate kinase